DLRITRTLRIEYAQRVLVERRLAVGRQLTPVRFQVLAQRGNVPRPVVGLTQRVEPKRDLAQPERAIELPAQRDHLDVEIRVVGAEHLDADLIELAIPATLRLL